MPIFLRNELSRGVRCIVETAQFWGLFRVRARGFRCTVYWARGLLSEAPCQKQAPERRRLDDTSDAPFPKQAPMHRDRRLDSTPEAPCPKQAPAHGQDGAVQTIHLKPLALNRPQSGAVETIHLTPHAQNMPLCIAV